MANRVYDKNVIADQQFQNAKRAGRANMAQAYNTAVTNKWKTDALNQMYPDFQVSGASGGRLYADPTAKDAIDNLATGIYRCGNKLSAETVPKN